MTFRKAAAAGAIIHDGWAIVVAVATGGEAPVVIDRRRFELADPDLPGNPYHHEALELELAEGEALILEVRRSVSERARQMLGTLRRDLSASCGLGALAVRESRPLPGTLAEILRSQTLYIADSEIYRDAMHDAARDLGLTVFLYPKAGEVEFAAHAIGADARGVAQRIRNWRKALGPPWQKDHRAAAAAAMGALAGLSTSTSIAVRRT
jgi:hypothetical protein